MATTFCISGATLMKAGINRYTGSAVFDAEIDNWINDAESFINVATRRNWIDIYGTLNTDVKLILHETASCLAGIYCIIYDMGGYTSRTEAEDIINVLRDTGLRNISILRDLKQQDFMIGA